MAETTLKQNTVTKVPLTRQINNTDCGAASLNMILAYFGKWVPLADTRQRCGVSRTGASAVGILKAAESYGLNGKGLQYSAEGLKEKGSFPCILFWDACHFLVLKGFRDGTAYLNDPSEGSVALPMEAFKKHYSGICLQLEPGPAFQPEGHKRTLLSFIAASFHNQQLPAVLVVLVLILSALTVLFESAEPLASRFFLDNVLIPESTSLYRALLCIMLIILSARFFTSLAHDVVGVRIRAMVDARDTTAFMQKLLILPLSFFEHRTTGDLLTRLKETSLLTDQMIGMISSAVLYVLGGIIYILAMLHYSIPLTLISAASIIVNFLASAYAENQRASAKRTLQQDTGMLLSTTISGIEAIRTIKSNGAEESYFQRWAGYQARAHNSLCRVNYLNHLFGSIPDLIVMLSDAQIALIGTFFIMKGNLSIGSLSAFFGFFQLLLVAARKLLFSASSEEMRILFERKEEVMFSPADPALVPEADRNLPLQPLKGDIQVRDVSFGYDPFSQPFISHFDLSVKPGEKIALVGPPGCGKSTILRLIGGLNSPLSGEILFDGKKRTEYDRYVMTSSVGMVLDKPFFFDGSIAENLRMWDSTVEQSALEDSARETGIHETIVRRKNGYNALVSSSPLFSFGELQRLELTRALAQNPSILLLDEATSALDALTNDRIMQNIKQHGLTMIVATQRVSSLQDYDEILVLDQGRVIERGTYEELLRPGTRFSEYAAKEKGESSDE